MKREDTKVFREEEEFLANKTQKDLLINDIKVMNFSKYIYYIRDMKEREII